MINTPTAPPMPYQEYFLGHAKTTDGFHFATADHRSYIKVSFVHQWTGFKVVIDPVSYCDRVGETVMQLILNPNKPHYVDIELARLIWVSLVAHDWKPCERSRRRHDLDVGGIDTTCEGR